MITAGGIKIERESGPFPTLNGTKRLFLVEKRTTLKLVSKSDQDISLYSIIAIVDGDDTAARGFWSWSHVQRFFWEVFRTHCLL
jgi:hypothetical protein